MGFYFSTVFQTLPTIISWKILVLLSSLIFPNLWRFQLCVYETTWNCSTAPLELFTIYSFCSLCLILDGSSCSISEYTNPLFSAMSDLLLIPFHVFFMSQILVFIFSSAVWFLLKYLYFISLLNFEYMKCSYCFFVSEGG